MHSINFVDTGWQSQMLNIKRKITCSELPIGKPFLLPLMFTIYIPTKEKAIQENNFYCMALMLCMMHDGLVLFV
jgi:hypothetical protein